MNSSAVQYLAADEAEMMRLGAKLAAASEPGLVIYLQGELGAGKTTFSRGFIRALCHRGTVKSPTYTLVEPYSAGTLEIYHFDLYRLGDAEELEFMGVRDYFGDHSLCLVEWPERGEGVLPPADLVITIAVIGAGRSLRAHAGSEIGRAVLQHWHCGPDHRDQSGAGEKWAGRSGSV
ncbi:tRNA (adenosine(37)-N6)-threonylcarbamoyltransferase complex ATPase subunit type 1 TsaE [Kineobactrum salinum]|uniref:tRNA threonylcarbamoyladenosine biosynthesis protein TsaE n=1 Tax=Kineobactrum salinum TaxID=2708301 RepID=A0A6C0U520_9GAMM|nr:tRNA (adenosine(37)-N6)-threonylcarbamoyltransferase complex ATPase subunit type 1 TsaE [Kineobactrum salinum]QIB66077.1 tRNA (adenosine(37)-N6)-threonylcarbamoyltransferase complex ATPase subunit type 1 TsaE [Kineobactrum salinum]